MRFMNLLCDAEEIEAMFDRVEYSDSVRVVIKNLVKDVQWEKNITWRICRTERKGTLQGMNDKYTFLWYK